MSPERNARAAANTARLRPPAQSLDDLDGTSQVLPPSGARTPPPRCSRAIRGGDRPPRELAPDRRTSSRQLSDRTGPPSVGVGVQRALILRGIESQAPTMRSSGLDGRLPVFAVEWLSPRQQPIRSDAGRRARSVARVVVHRHGRLTGCGKARPERSIARVVAGDADQVVGGGGDLEPGPVAFSAGVAQLAATANRLDPAEGFVDMFARCRPPARRARSAWRCRRAWREVRRWLDDVRVPGVQLCDAAIVAVAGAP